MNKKVAISNSIRLPISSAPPWLTAWATAAATLKPSNGASKRVACMYWRIRSRDQASQVMAAAAAAPATELVVPALPHHEPGEQTHTLRLFAPDGAAVVELRALTEHGAHIPDPAVVRVPAGSTVEVEMDDLPDGPGALRLRSDAPVTAGARLQVAPVSDEPIVLEEDAPEGDDAQATSAPDDAQATSGPEDAQATSVPDAPPQAEPVLHPAGESAWVAAVPLSEVPLGIAVPDLSDLPGLTEQAREPVVALAVSAVDGTTATVLRLDDRDRVRTEQLTLANDTTHVLEVPSGTVALWVLPAQDVGVAAALHLSHQDVVGPYLTSASLAQVPWTRAVPPVVPVLP